MNLLSQLCLGVLLSALSANACTNYLVTPGASADGSAMISYAADSGSLYGTLGFYPAANHTPGSTRTCYDWDSGKYLGEIPEVASTYNVVGNTNEFQLTIAETTFGGLGSLSSQSGAIIDYGSLIWITLQRAKNVQEAITVMDDLMQKYGYASDGESFSLADPKEVWLMEVMSKGEGELGSVWVAQKIPDGYVSGHANQARIRTFNHNDPSTSRFAHDVVDFARKKGLYPSDKADSEFSFSDTFDPVSFTGARLCECRVWNMFRQVAAEDNFGDRYLDYVKGENLTHRMPLFIKPRDKISLNDTFWFMRSHYEGTYFDMTVDVGAGQYASAYRARPLFWETSDKVTYHNERPIGVQQTAWHFTAQMRSFLPDIIGAVVWFAVDDTAHSVHVPFYPSVTKISEKWADKGIQHVDDEKASLKVSFDSAWWLFNMVANLCYNRYDAMNPVVQAKIVEVESGYFKDTQAIEEKAKGMIQDGKTAEVREMLTQFSMERADNIVVEWLEFWKELFFKFRDYFVVSPPAAPAHPKDHPWPSVVQGGYPTKWNDVVAKETGDHYLVPKNLDMALENRKLKAIRKGSK